MDFLTDWLTDWLKELLIGGIMGNLEGLFDYVNTLACGSHPPAKSLRTGIPVRRL